MGPNPGGMPFQPGMNMPFRGYDALPMHARLMLCYTFAHVSLQLLSGVQRPERPVRSRRDDAARDDAARYDASRYDAARYDERSGHGAAAWWPNVSERYATRKWRRAGRYGSPGCGWILYTGERSWHERYT